MNITYIINNNLYINITNKCPCRCTFCIRDGREGMNENQTLWLKKEPEVLEVIEDLQKYELELFDEIVFCGFGEPLVRINEVVEICTWLKNSTKTHIRINTNGLASLVHKKDTASMLEGLVDTVSISLNAPTKNEYNEVTRPFDEENAFESMLEFAINCNKVIENVVLSVVDSISEEQILKSQQLADELGLRLRIRPKD